MALNTDCLLFDMDQIVTKEVTPRFVWAFLASFSTTISLEGLNDTLSLA